MTQRCRCLGAACLLTIMLSIAACGGGGVADEPESTSTSDAGPAEDAAEPALSVEPALAAKLQAALEAARAEQDLPGLAMAVEYRRTRRVWVSATGFSDLGTEARWQPGDQSRIGSVTKTFTAAIIMQLAEEATLSLDDAIETWVPGWYAGPTLKQLLGHTSGIVSYNYVASFDMARAWTPEQLVQWAYDNEPKLRFAPGSQWEYSNTNYVLLGMVIEKATGKSYADALRARLFAPLSLDMRLALSGDDDPRLVRAYSGTPPEDVSADADPSYGWAAGAIVSAPADLAHWTVALYGGELLAPASLALMTTPGGVTSPDQEDYGLGTFIESDAEHTLVGHPGGIGGYQSYAYYLEPEDVALVLMSNRVPTDLRAAAGHALEVLVSAE